MWVQWSQCNGIPCLAFLFPNWHDKEPNIYRIPFSFPPVKAFYFYNKIYSIPSDLYIIIFCTSLLMSGNKNWKKSRLGTINVNFLLPKTIFGLSLKNTIFALYTLFLVTVDIFVVVEPQVVKLYLRMPGLFPVYLPKQKYSSGRWIPGKNRYNF